MSENEYNELAEIATKTNDDYPHKSKVGYKYGGFKEVSKKKKIEEMSEIARINELARKKGLSYGQYVARYGDGTL